MRYYDEIDILKPAKISDSGYRIYSDNEVDLLQQILFYKELGLDLKTIKDIISSPSFDILEALSLIHIYPDKLGHLEEYGIKINERVSTEEEITKYNIDYLRTKRDKMGHMIDIG